MVTRKNFIHLASLSLGAMVVPDLLLGQSGNPPRISDQLPGTDPNKAQLATALNAARAKGASYADVRLGSYPPANIQAGGIGVRVLVNGTWGFAATNIVTDEAIVQCAEEAVRMAVSKGKSSGVQRHAYDSRYSHDLWICGFLRR